MSTNMFFVFFLTFSLESLRPRFGIGLEKDTTPATAEMLSNMRTEMYEFSAPFFQKAVKGELEDIRARQKKLLKKIIAIDDGDEGDEDKDDDADDDVDIEEAGKKRRLGQTDLKRNATFQNSKFPTFWKV